VSSVRQKQQHSLVAGAEDAGLPPVRLGGRQGPRGEARHLLLQLVALLQQLLHNLRLLLVLVLQLRYIVLHLTDFVKRNLNVLAFEGLDTLGKIEEFLAVQREMAPFARVVRMEIGVDEDAGQWFLHVEVVLQDPEREWA
jgi:hypothetical protein